MADTQVQNPNPAPVFQPQPGAMLAPRVQPPAQQADARRNDEKAADAEKAKEAADNEQRDRDDKRDVESKRNEAVEARKRVNEAYAKAADAAKSDEQREVERLSREADDAEARANQAEIEERAPRRDHPMTAREAGVVAPHVDHRTPAGHHRAVKRGSDPSNPAPARAEHENPELQTVRLTRPSPDVEGPIECYVHPEMVGDYLRAGWTQAA